MNILGIDFGLSKVGLAIASGPIAEPYQVIGYVNVNELIEKVREVTEREQIRKIVVGLSEGEMAEKTIEFVDQIKNQIGISVETADETLSTQDAQRMGIEAHMRRSKRQNMEDAMAAAVMLQNYIDTRGL